MKKNNYSIDTRKSKVIDKNVIFKKNTRIITVLFEGSENKIMKDDNNIVFGIVTSARKNIIKKALLFGIDAKRLSNNSLPDGAIENRVYGSEAILTFVKITTILYKDKFISVPVYTSDVHPGYLILLEAWEE